MDNEKLYSVLTEILEEQRENTKLLLEVKTTLKQIEEKSQNSEIRNNSTNGYQLQEKLSDELKEIKVFLTSMPQNIRQEKRFLFFPEYNAKEYYSVILKWILYLVITRYVYWIIKEFINRNNL